MKRLFFAAVSVVALSACQTTSAPPAMPQLTQFDDRLAEAAERAGAPGLVAAIYRDGRIMEVFAYGASHCDGTGEANVNAAWEVGSISKEMAAVGLLKLWEQGRVELDASVGTYLDDIPEAWRAVTIRQLLTHTSGVPDYEEEGGYGVYETTPTPQQVYDIVRAKPLDFEPGTQWHYSNTGYFLLSLVIQRVSGMHFGDYMRERVFEPLGMHHTFVSGYAPAGVEITQGCKPGEGEDAPPLPVRPISEASTFGAGGILSTLQDWALWDDALRDGRLLSARGMHELTTPQRLANGEDTGYAMGLFTQPWRNEPAISHSGQTQGFVALYQTFPARESGVMLFTNRYQADPTRLMNELMLRAVPALSYNQIPIPPDPDPTRTERVRRSLRQLILTEQPLDLLDPEILPVATEERFASQRDGLREEIANMARLAYVRAEAPGEEYARYLYKVTTRAGDVSYFTVGWRNDLLYRLRWERE